MADTHYEDAFLTVLISKEDLVSVRTTPLSDQDTLDRLDQARVTQASHGAADVAFRARVKNALSSQLQTANIMDLARGRRELKIAVRRWLRLTRSTREAESPEEFQAFAQILGVSARWLAVGCKDSSPDGAMPMPTHALVLV